MNGVFNLHVPMFYILRLQRLSCSLHANSMNFRKIRCDFVRRESDEILRAVCSNVTIGDLCINLFFELLLWNINVYELFSLSSKFGQSTVSEDSLLGKKSVQ